MASTQPSDFESALLSLALPLLSSLQTGALITWGLQGIICVQSYNYYLSFPKDPLYMKLLVYSSLLFEIVQTILVTRDTYSTFTEGYGNFAALDDIHLLWLTLPIVGGCVGMLCHLTFAYRISLLSESKIIGAVIAAMAICASVSAFTFGGKLFNAGVLSKAVTVKYIYLTCGIWNGAGALCDVTIAACMTYFLTRSNTGFRNTDYLVTRIVRLTIETGMVTATSSIASAVLFVGFRERLSISVYFIIPALMLTKLYAITILATFNNRPHAVGGPPPLSDMENCYDDNKTYSRKVDQMGSEIRIGRTVVRQVWKDGKDDVPMSHINIYEEDGSSQSIKDDGESSRKVSDTLTPEEEGTSPKKF